MPMCGQTVWKIIWKLTLGVSHTNATNATLYLFGKATWGNIWNDTLERNRSNATFASLHLFLQANSVHIWKFTLGKNRSNAVNVTMQLFEQALWWYIWKLIQKRISLQRRKKWGHSFDDLQSSFKYGSSLLWLRGWLSSTSFSICITVSTYTTCSWYPWLLTRSMMYTIHVPKARYFVTTLLQL